MKVAIIGAGELGMALAKVLAGKAEIAIWDIDPAKALGMLPLKETVSGAEVIFCAVPSFAMREAATGLKPCIDLRKVAVISLAKGIEKPTKKFMDKVLAELLPGGCSGVMGGPMLAAELGAGEECIAAVGFSNPDTGHEMTIIEELFADTNLRIESSDDPHGIAIAGVLKNIYAVLMGMAAGFKLGEDETAWLATRAMEEMVKIGTRLGGREETITGTAGFADFLATAYSVHSRNRSAGITLANNGMPGLAANQSGFRGEGILSLPSLLDLLGVTTPKLGLERFNIPQLPLLSLLADIVIKDYNSEDIFRDLFKKK